jgi:hypothetical protein
MEWVFSVIKGELGTDCHSREHHPVLVSIMSVHCLETVELLEPSVHRFMSSSSVLLCLLVNKRNVVIGSSNRSSLTSVAIVSLDFLARSEHLLQSVSKDLDAGPSATGERAMDPDDISSLDTNCNLIPQSSCPKLVGEPLLVERLWLVDTEVGAINCHFASLALITPESIASANLKGETEMVRMQNKIAALVPAFLPHKAPCRQSSAEGATPTFETSSVDLQEQKCPEKVLGPHIWRFPAIARDVVPDVAANIWANSEEGSKILFGRLDLSVKQAR